MDIKCVFFGNLDLYMYIKFLIDILKYASGKLELRKIFLPELHFKITIRVRVGDSKLVLNAKPLHMTLSHSRFSLFHH